MCTLMIKLWMCTWWSLFQHRARNACCLLARLVMIWISCPCVYAQCSLSSYRLARPNIHTHKTLFLLLSSQRMQPSGSARQCGLGPSHGYHDLTQTTFVSSFITVPPQLSTLVYSSMLYFCIPASRVKMHATSTTENNPQKSPLIFTQICKRQQG